VTVITDEGRQWNVSPGVLSRVIPTEATKAAGGSNRVRLGKR
jgi:hypothetical protein